MEFLPLNYVLVVLQLAILEGLLSFDNALALAALVRKRLAHPLLRKRALVWGLWGAYILRTVMLFAGVGLMKYEWVKALAGLYLVYLAIHELFFSKKKHGAVQEVEPLQEAGLAKKGKRKYPPPTAEQKKAFWHTVLQVEIMDLMFSIDSVAVALAVSDNPWVLISGAFLGIVLMRIAAQTFVKLLVHFPILEKTAFVMVGVAGINVVLKIKDLPLGFAALTINRPLPEGVFLGAMFAILVGSLFLNKVIYKNKPAQ